jgi:competence ComEA-like helix-hairpin-helix protein
MKRILVALFAWLAAIHMAFAAVDINTAGEAELDKLPGIGPTKAKAIVEDRAKNGPFRSVEDLKRVKGIGDKTFEDLKGQITVGGKAGPAPKAEAKPAPLPKAEPKSVPAPALAAGGAVPKPAGGPPAAPAAAKPAAAPAAVPAPAGAKPSESKSSAPPAPAGAKPAAPAAAAKPAEAKPSGATPAPAGAAGTKKPAQDDKPADKK